MTAPAKNARRTLIWIVLAVLLAGLGIVAGLSLYRKKNVGSPVAAYLVPIDNDSRVKLSWWPAKKIAAPVALHSDEPVSIPNGSKIKLIHTDTGKAEDIAGPAKIVLQRKLPSETETLSSPLDEVFKQHIGFPPTERRLILTSPVGITRYLNPLIDCENGMPPFDVLVVDPADPDVPPRIAKNIRLPIQLSALETPQRRQLAFDRNYEIYVRESGDRNVKEGAARCLTSSDAQFDNQIPATPADLMIEAFAAMAKKPYRTGDAWLALSRLPPEWAKSELGVRLRLLVGAELFSGSQVEEARKDAAKVMRLR
ncbi:MAG: hypothetical protein QM715_17075 [Nibricoccus sp.]